MNREEYFQRGFHENELINQRLNWLLASQTLLFAGYGALLTVDLHQEIKERMAKIGTIIGISSAFLIWMSIIAAVGASIYLWRMAKISLGDDSFPLGLRTWTTWLGWAPALLLPILFIGAWALLPTRDLGPPESFSGAENVNPSGVVRSKTSASTRPPAEVIGPETASEQGTASSRP